MAFFYRFTHTDPPTLYDFKSHAERAEKGRPKLVHERDWAGLSLRVSLPDARAFYARRDDDAKARLGAFITEVDLPDGLEIEQVGSDPGHYEVWAPAEEILGYMTHNTVPAVA